MPFTTGQLTTVLNAGVIDLTNGGTSTSDRLGIAGNYLGLNGRLVLNTVLAGDGSPSDRLVVSGGVMAGSTTIAITNVGGQGAQTTGNGIRVVTAASGAVSTAIRLLPVGPRRGRRLRVPALPRRLHPRHRQQLVPAQHPRADPAGSSRAWPDADAKADGPGPARVRGDGGDTSGPRTQADAADAASVGITGGMPLYRPEVALHAVMPSVARTAVRATLGTFHDREGETAFASGDGAFKAGWARLFGGSYKQSWSGDVSPGFNGTVLGVQVGLPLLGLEHGSGEKDRADCSSATLRRAAASRASRSASRACRSATSPSAPTASAPTGPISGRPAAISTPC